MTLVTWDINESHVKAIGTMSNLPSFSPKHPRKNILSKSFELSFLTSSYTSESSPRCLSKSTVAEVVSRALLGGWGGGGGRASSLIWSRDRSWSSESPSWDSGAAIGLEERTRVDCIQEHDVLVYVASGVWASQPHFSALVLGPKSKTAQYVAADSPTAFYIVAGLIGIRTSETYSRAGNARELSSTCGMPLSNTSLDFHPKHAAFLHTSHLQALAAYGVILGGKWSKC